MYQRKVDVDVLNTSPSSERSLCSDEGLTLETSEQHTLYGVQRIRINLTSIDTLYILSYRYLSADRWRVAFSTMGASSASRFCKVSEELHSIWVSQTLKWQFLGNIFSIAIRNKRPFGRFVSCGATLHKLAARGPWTLKIPKGANSFVGMIWKVTRLNN